MKLKDAMNKYFRTRQFSSLSRSSQLNYEYALASICRMSVMGRTLGNVNIKKLNAAMCLEIYDTVELGTSTSNANHIARVFSVLMNFLISIDEIPNNPMARVKKRSSEPRSVIWTHDQVMSLLDAAFDNFEWRNIGLIVLMCYEWGQRPIDIRNLTWESVDLEQGKVTITQSKRGATVELPIPDNLLEMLTEQKKDWDFQEYVVTNPRKKDSAYRQLTVSQRTSLLGEGKDTVGLHDDLRVGGLRKTEKIKMTASSVKHQAIKTVTDHKS